MIAKVDRSRYAPLPCVFGKASTHLLSQRHAGVRVRNEQRTPSNHYDLVRKQWLLS